MSHEENGSGSTMLATRPQQQTGLTVYDRVDPMDFIEKMGKVFALSAAGGCKNENEGKLMALACLSERKTIFEIARRYHLMAGKLVLKAETMLGDFRRAGGKHKWLNDGTDGKTASLQLTDREGNTVVSTFTIEKAKAAGYVKGGSNWEKRPDQQLRARCITDGVRMLCPEISSGEVAEEEVDDFPQPPVTAAASAPIRSAEEVQKRRQELQAGATTGTAKQEQIVEATVEPVAVKTEAKIEVKAEPVSTEPAPFDVQAIEAESKPVTATKLLKQDASQKVVMEIELTITQAGLTIEKVVNALNKKNSTSYKSLDDIPEDSALTLLENLRAILKKQTEQAGAAGASAGSPTATA